MAPKPKVEEDEAQVEAGEGEEVGGDAEGEEGEEGEEEVIETGPTVAEIVTAKPETAAVSEEVCTRSWPALIRYFYFFWKCENRNRFLLLRFALFRALCRRAQWRWLRT